jgi:hypothetical protein
MTRLESLMATLVNLFMGFYKVTFGGSGKNSFLVGSGTVGSSTNVQTGDWCAVQIITTTGNIDSITLDGTVRSLTGITFLQGFMLYGKITSITVPTGTTVICYGALTVTN